MSKNLQITYDSCIIAKIRDLDHNIERIHGGLASKIHTVTNENGIPIILKLITEMLTIMLLEKE